MRYVVAPEFPVCLPTVHPCELTDANGRFAIIDVRAGAYNTENGVQLAVRP